MTTILVSLQLLIAFFSPPASETETAQPPLVDLRSALPLPLRAARIRAIEAEDHYVRVHTSAGQALVRMRLRDAMASLSDQEGLQPHRSWWVAKDDIVALSRADGRATLRLAGGLEVPVSRKAAQALGPDFSA